MKKCPDEYISRWFSILHRLSLSYVYDGLKKFNIGSGQVMFLLELYYQGGVSQEELSRLLNIDGANTTRAVRKLEQEGYVRREQNPQDRRAYQIFLTEKALALKPEIFQLIRNWEDTLLQNLSEEERAVFSTLLKRIGHTVADNLRCKGCDFDCN
ncbi:MAG: MarR family winged helix-turn-helix transcriptional regulator [Candidatus Wallacebacter cryptica]